MRHLTALLPALLAALPASGETSAPAGSLRVAAAAELLSYPDPQAPAVTRLAAATQRRRNYTSTSDIIAGA
ncbi:hypothetical protein [Mangrovicoccus ximenensis]|uniref:hypothetical protein n=1 Tax=Mangrovicoccus ximenensis TaxID=1911570 RepID=UPI0011AE68C9|nr:hypothetical protein [Mangrovicoccus ximenensis]